jgi:hypothetical protein
MRALGIEPAKGRFDPCYFGSSRLTSVALNAPRAIPERSSEVEP